MKFVDVLLSFLEDAINAIIDAFSKFIDFLAVPLAYLLEFLKAIFYFIFKLFDVAVELIMLFVALFQFLFAVCSGVFRTIVSWLTINPSKDDVAFPSTTYTGFEVVTDLLQPTGVMTVVPMLCVAFVWFYFILKVIGLFGGQIYIRPFGSDKS